jgi:hypothetical protein
MAASRRECGLFRHERSDLSHWRKRLGDMLELLLAESHRPGACERRAADEGPDACCIDRFC